MDIANKKALVFGGTSGIGLSTCEQLIEKGADVIAISRDPSKATSVKHNKLSFESCDVRIEEEVKNIFEKQKAICLSSRIKKKYTIKCFYKPNKTND